MTTMTASHSSNNDTTKLAPFNPTSDQAIAVAIDFMELGANDVVWDIGCGDARVLIRAVASCRHVRCVGMECDPQCLSKALDQLDVELNSEQRERIELRCGDVLAAEASPISIAHFGAQCSDLCLENDCTVLYLYLLPKGLQKLRPLLDQLRENGKVRSVVTYMFSIRHWTPTKGEK